MMAEQHMLKAETGKFSLTGQDAQMQTTLGAEPGRVDVTGHAAAGNPTLNANPGAYSMTGKPAALQVTTVAVKKNWPLIVLYVVLQLAFVGASYWPERWASVGVAGAGSVISAVLGFYIVVKVVTNTIR